MTSLGLRPRAVIPALDGSRSPSASCDELDARCAFPRFRLSTRKVLLHSNQTLYTQGPLFRTLAREEAIFADCKRCANDVFACLCKEKINERYTKRVKKVMFNMKIL